MKPKSYASTSWQAHTLTCHSYLSPNFTTTQSPLSARTTSLTWPSIYSQSHTASHLTWPRSQNSAVTVYSQWRSWCNMTEMFNIDQKVTGSHINLPHQTVTETRCVAKLSVSPHGTQPASTIGAIWRIWSKQNAWQSEKRLAWPRPPTCVPILKIWWQSVQYILR